MFEEYKIKPGCKVKLCDYTPGYKGKMSKSELKEKAAGNCASINLLQQKLYAESKQSLLIVLQAIDAGGKDGTIRKVFGGINPQGCRVSSFKKPSELELSHDFLWRIHKETPAKGMMAIFNRSHYEDVIVVRVHDWIDGAECKRRYKNIKDFERLLTEQNTTILKFFLYISPDEQKKRFQERLDIKEKNWKFAFGDLDERKLWDTYMKQFEDVFEHTSTDYAPWYIVPANNKTYRNYVISSIVKKTMQKMDPKFPPPEKGLDKVVLK